MYFPFDPKKAVNNLKKHGVSFADAEGVFYDPLAIHMEDADAEGEERFMGASKNPLKPRWRRGKRTQNAHLLRVNSAFSPVFALPSSA
ncbi:MAG TPA: BrnT family toxin [Gammaproteobacteria bacterium]|nr:BrnT family toxin [Gammaproteobacteria bacterium]